MGDVDRSISIRVLGGVRASVNGEEVRLSSKQAATLAVLAAAGPTGISKDELYEELYGHDPQRTGSHLAVMRIHRLRRRLEVGDAQAITPAPRYGIDDSVCTVDAWSMEEAFRADDTSAAVAAIERWEEPFVGIELEPPVVLAARETLRRRFRASLVRVAWSIEPGADEHLVEVLLDQVETDMHDEQLTVATAAALYRLGRQSLALDLLTTCRDRLRADYGLDATPRFDEMELAILQHDDTVLSSRRTGGASRPAVRLVPGGAALRAPPRLVGRSDLLDELDELVRDHKHGARTGPGSVYALVGPAGCGKSSVVATALEPHVATGLTVRLGRPGGGDRRRSNRGVFDVLLAALPELQREIDAEQVHDRSAAPGGRRVRTWRHLHARICEMVAHEPAVLVLEDLHDADSQTLDFLRFFAASARPPTLLLVLTSRPSAAGDVDVLAGLTEPSVVAVRTLPPLTREDVRRLVALDHPTQPPVVRERFATDVHRLSQGNALVASVLSRDAQPATGATLMVSGTLDHVDSLARHLDGKVTDPQLRQLLSVAGVIGHEFDVDVLRTLVDGTQVDVDGLLREAHRLDVCRPVDHERWSFDHPLTASHFGQQLHLLRPTLAARLATMPGVTPAEMVRHVATAGDSLDDGVSRRLLHGAATTLEEQRAFPEAAAALSMLAELTDGVDRSSVLVRLAAAESRRGDLVAAREARAAAFAAFRADDDHEGMYAAATAGLPSGEHAGGDEDRLEMLAEVDVTRLRSVRPAEFARWQLRFARLCDRPALVRSTIDAIDPAWAENDPEAWTTLQLERVSALATSGEARPIRRELEELVERTDDPLLRADLLHRRAVAALVEQDTDVVEVYEQSLAVTRVAGVGRTRWASDVLGATLALSGIRPSATDAAAARRSGLKWGIPDLFSTWGVQVWMEHWVSGDIASAARLLAEVQQATPSNVAWEAAAALCLAATGNVRAARGQVREVVNRVKEAPDGVWVPVAAALLVEAAGVLDDADAAFVGAAALAPRGGQSIVLGLGAAHFGPVDRYLGIAAGLADDRPGAIRLVRAAVDQADASRSATWAAIARRDLAEIEP